MLVFSACVYASLAETTTAIAIAQPQINKHMFMYESPYVYVHINVYLNIFRPVVVMSSWAYDRVHCKTARRWTWGVVINSVRVANTPPFSRRR